jgi:hypothetical protein
MHTSKASCRKWPGIGIVILWQLGLVVGSFALALWLWPAGLLEAHLFGLTLEYVFRAVVSIAFLAVGITSLYLVAVEPFARIYTELYRRD